MADPQLPPQGHLTPTRALLNTLGRLPLGVLQGLARLIAWVLLCVPEQGMARTVRRNLMLCFPQWSADQLTHMTRQAVRQQMLTSVEFLRVWGNPPEDSLKRIHTVYGRELLDRSLADPRGCMVIVPHHGNFEMMNAWLSQLAAPVIMYKPDKNPDLDQFVRTARSRLNTTLAPTDERGVRQIFRVLKQGGLTILLADHLPEPSGGILSPFFGWPVLTSTLASKLAHKTQCAMFMMSCIRRDDDAQRFDIFIDPVCDGLHDADLQVSVDALNRSMEVLITRHPTHYHWAYKRFKLTPTLPDYYHIDADAAQQLSRRTDMATDADTHSV